MEHIYNYIKFFQPSKTYTEEFQGRFLDALHSLKRELKNSPPDISPYVYRNWHLPYGQNLSKYHYNILYALAKFCRVKLMWKNVLVRSTFNTLRGLTVIGEEHRVDIFIHVLNHYITAELGYAKYIKENKRVEAKEQNFKHVGLYASKLIESQRELICTYCKEILEENKIAERKLENYIMAQFKLDFKNYPTDKKLYYNAITTSFVEKRMLL